MKIKFNLDSKMDEEEMHITTNTNLKSEWNNIEAAIINYANELILIDASNDNKVPIKHGNIISIESEERMCNVTLDDGRMFLLNMRLKAF